MSSDPPFASFHRSDTVVELKLVGDFESSAAAEVHQTVLEVAAANRDAVICCEQVGFLGAAALQSLIALANTLGSRGRRVRFVGVQGPLEQWLYLAGLA